MMGYLTARSNECLVVMVCCSRKYGRIVFACFSWRESFGVCRDGGDGSVVYR
jgi:hypothetical protein